MLEHRKNAGEIHVPQYIVVQYIVALLVISQIGLKDTDRYMYNICHLYHKLGSYSCLNRPGTTCLQTKLFLIVNITSNLCSLHQKIVIKNEIIGYKHVIRLLISVLILYNGRTIEMCMYHMLLYCCHCYFFLFPCDNFSCCKPNVILLYCYLLLEEACYMYTNIFILGSFASTVLREKGTKRGKMGVFFSN